MSNRTSIELNHDYIPKDDQLEGWAKSIAAYMRTGDVDSLPQGVEFKHMRHHSEPDPLAAVKKRIKRYVSGRNKGNYKSSD